MAASEWMELENLSSEIANSISRLEAAKLVGSNGLAQVIQKEIAALEERRSRLLANIASAVVGDKSEETEPEAKSEPVPEVKPEARAEPAWAPEPEPKLQPEPEPEPEPARDRGPIYVPPAPAVELPVEAPVTEIRAPEPQRVEIVAPMSPPVIATPEPSRYEEPPRRGGASWNQLTPADVERAKRDLNQRRIETLARHAAELRALDTDQEDIDALEHAIEVFTRKFAVQQPAGAEVVRLEPERGVRRSVG